jgi:mono/diheme cytochrome c family protein
MRVSENKTMSRYGNGFAGLIVALSIGLSVVSLPATAQPVVTDQQGSVERGRELAQAWCAECHAIGPKVTQGKRPGPNFIDFANRASTTPLSLNVFLRSNHETMPNLIVARGEADDLVAYILSLKHR